MDGGTVETRHKKRKEPLPSQDAPVGNELVDAGGKVSEDPDVSEDPEVTAKRPRLEGNVDLATPSQFAGEDSNGAAYASEEALWRSLKREKPSEDKEGSGAGSADEGKPWYKGSEDYWAKVEPTLDGVLGGFGFLSTIDTKTSRAFLSNFIPAICSASASTSPSSSSSPTPSSSLGAVPSSTRIDLVEPDARFLDKAKQQLAPLQPLNGHRVEGFFYEGLQSFAPAKAHYDLIWIQWVIGYLTDEDFVAFLKRCAEALRENGIIVIKDNLNSKEGFYVDKEDNSITRSDGYLRRLFQTAGLALVHDALQEEFPPGMLPVRMYALRPTASTSS